MADIVFEEPAGSGQFQLISFDAVVRDSHESTATVTEHPVEQGANISDHVRPDLDRVVLEAIVSNTPITQPVSQADGATGAPGDVDLINRDGDTIGAARVLLFDGEFDRVRSVYDELRRLKDTGTVVDIITSLREYDSMIIRAVNPQRDASSGSLLRIQIEATQIRIVESEIVEAPVPDENQRNRGRQEEEETDEETEERSTDLLIQIGEFLGGLGG